MTFQMRIAEREACMEGENVIAGKVALIFDTD
jgi:hypothetical protein